jgi:hypothetical protein
MQCIHTGRRFLPPHPSARCRSQVLHHQQPASILSNQNRSAPAATTRRTPVHGACPEKVEQKYGNIVRFELPMHIDYSVLLVVDGRGFESVQFSY